VYPDPHTRDFRRPIQRSLIGFTTIFFLSSILLFIYSGSLDGPFIFDSEPNILLNQAIRLEELTLSGLKKAISESPSRRRPVANISFALNYYAFGYTVSGYRLVNVAIHLVTGLLLFLLADLTLSTPALEGRYPLHREIAFFAMILWLLHPLAVQSVAYVVQRMTSLSAMFFVLSLWLYAKGRMLGEAKKRWWLWLGSVGSGLLAVGSKENGAMLPLFVLLYEWYFFQYCNLRWFKRRSAFLLLGVLSFAVLALIFLRGHPLAHIMAGYSSRDFTLTERLLTEMQVVVYYLTLLFFPHPGRLNLDYDFGLSTSLLDPLSTLFSLVLLIGLVGLAVYAAKSQRLLSFSIIWFLGNLVIESSVVPLEIIFEHRTYLPSMLVIVVLVAFIYQIFKQKWVRWALLSSLIAVCLLWTYQRANVWGDELILWQDVVSKSPDKPRPNFNFGNALRDRGRIDEAIVYFRKALAADPQYVKAWQNLGDAFMRVGDPEQALEYFAKAAELEPKSAQAHLGRGNALSQLGRTEKAIEAYQEVLRISPFNVRALVGLGGQLIIAERESEAIDPLLEAIRLDPGNASAHYNIGLAFAEEGQIETAVKHFRRAAELDRNHVLARRNLGVLLFNQGDMEAAIAYFSDAVRLEPDNASAHDELGFALLTAGRPEQAIKEFRSALQLEPGLVSAKQRLESALKRLDEKNLETQ
jgi:tetratricopeptide (TPR) repeat protein